MLADFAGNKNDPAVLTFLPGETIAAAVVSGNTLILKCASGSTFVVAHNYFWIGDGSESQMITGNIAKLQADIAAKQTQLSEQQAAAATLGV